jgi:hypothetical protein
MTPLSAFGACAVALMMASYALEDRAPKYTLIFAFACVAASVYGWLAGTWPFGALEAIWAIVAFRKWWRRRRNFPTGEAVRSS